MPEFREIEEEIVCNNCGWTGSCVMLVCETDALDDRYFNYCPDCGSGDIENMIND